MSKVKIKQVGGLQDALNSASTGGVTQNVEIFTDGTDYTSGTSQSITLSITPDNEDYITVNFDGVTQQHDTYTLSGNTITFDTIIPSGTNKIEVTILTSTKVGTAQVVEIFKDGTDYTSGTTTSLTLTNTPADENQLTISFDGIVQQHDAYSLIGNTVTFNNPIPSGTLSVEAVVFVAGISSGGGGGSSSSFSYGGTATLSGTSTIVSGITAGKNKIVLKIDEMLFSSTNNIKFRLGHSGNTIVNTGYQAKWSSWSTTGTLYNYVNTDSVLLMPSTFDIANNVYDGEIVLYREAENSNRWLIRTFVMSNASGNAFQAESVGILTLPAELDSFEFSVSAGTFSGGTIRVIYEG